MNRYHVLVSFNIVNFPRGLHFDGYTLVVISGQSFTTRIIIISTGLIDVRFTRVMIVLRRNFVRSCGRMFHKEVNFLV